MELLCVAPVMHAPHIQVMAVLIGVAAVCCICKTSMHDSCATPSRACTASGLSRDTAYVAQPLRNIGVFECKIDVQERLDEQKRQKETDPNYGKEFKAQATKEEKAMRRNTIVSSIGQPICHCHHLEPAFC